MRTRAVHVCAMQTYFRNERFCGWSRHIFLRATRAVGVVGAFDYNLAAEISTRVVVA